MQDAALTAYDAKEFNSGKVRLKASFNAAPVLRHCSICPCTNTSSIYGLYRDEKKYHFPRDQFPLTLWTLLLLNHKHNRFAFMAERPK